MDSSEIGVLEERDKVSLGSLLESHDGRRLEAEISLGILSLQTTVKRAGKYLEVLGDFTDEALEGELANQKLRRLLVPPNLTKSDGSGPEAMGLLDTTSGGLYCKLGIS